MRGKRMAINALMSTMASLLASLLASLRAAEDGGPHSSCVPAQTPKQQNELPANGVWRSVQNQRSSSHVVHSAEECQLGLSPGRDTVQAPRVPVGTPA